MQALGPDHIVPSHGHATDIKQAKADTLDYLVLLRRAVRKFMDKGGEIQDVRSLNQYPLSPYERLIGYDIVNGAQFFACLYGT